MLLWGVTQCGGSSEVKVKCFYEILQDPIKDKIANSDKDFPENFALLIDLATRLVNDYEPLLSGKAKELPDAFMTELEERRPTLADVLFLDKVFNARGFITREDWENNVLTGVRWLFDAEELRKTVYEYIRNQINE